MTTKINEPLTKTCAYRICYILKKRTLFWIFWVQPAFGSTRSVFPSFPYGGARPIDSLKENRCRRRQSNLLCPMVLWLDLYNNLFSQILLMNVRVTGITKFLWLLRIYTSHLKLYTILKLLIAWYDRGQFLYKINDVNWEKIKYYSKWVMT